MNSIIGLNEKGSRGKHILYKLNQKLTSDASKI